MSVLKPSRLRKGDLIGVVSPASPVQDISRIERAVRYLEGLGYRVIVGNNVGKTKGYLAGTDGERVADLHVMFAEKSVKAIMCLRGGYGTPRLLPLLNYRLIKQNPKILVGYSDITALQLALWKKCRLVSFHGPMPGVDMANGMDSSTEEFFWVLLTSKKIPGRLDFPDMQPVMLAPGRTSGRLLGGNLSLIVSLFGTPYQPDFNRSLLFIEEIDEEPYRIDRMMTQLWNSSVLAKVSGVISGQFTDCQPQDPSRPSLSIHEILADVALRAGKPFLSNLLFSHGPRKITLPIGVKATMTKSGILEYLEPAVC